MAAVRGHQRLLLVCLGWALTLPARGGISHLVIDPQPHVLEIGTNFMPTCMIINTTEVTADDLYWTISETIVPKEQYTKINASALSVSVPITSETPEWLICSSNSVLPYVLLNKAKFHYGIFLTKGYRPGKPENLSCVAIQKGKEISPTISCMWEPVGRQSAEVPTTYTLKVSYASKEYSVNTRENRSEVTLSLFPNHMTMEIWVEAHNKLGKTESEHLKQYAGWFVKTNPPSDVKANSEEGFPTSLFINWTHPIADVYLLLRYEIRFCQNGSQSWTYVPSVDTTGYIPSFRLQKLRPDTVYVTQVRCRNAEAGHGYWSDWSTNATERTAEDRPTSKPDLWKIIEEGDSINERRVQIICKDPVFANGRIKQFDLKIQDQKDKVEQAGLEWESVPVDRVEADSRSSQITVLKQLRLANKESLYVNVMAINSVGKSPVASLVVLDKAHELPPVEELKVWPHEGQLWLKWKSPNTKAVLEYVVEWDLGGQIDWQRENRSTRQTAIKGNLQRFVCYTLSVYPIYPSGKIGKPASMEAFLEQGAPLEGPVIKVNGKPGRNEAELQWTEIPRDRRQGFITNYTIFYTTGTEVHAVSVPGTTTSYTLTSLSGDTRYDIWISASTIRGSTQGFNHSFITLKYAPGEIEGIVVGVSLGFLFIVLMIMLLCIYKRDVIKENFWPQIPDPGASTIGNWSPDYPLKAETPRESCVSGISVLDVDVCDEKCLFDEDKASLPLKKDKYLSEEHSSGIGGSSCMSSPRQSVSDSDEGGDTADTTASTVQYSSVVASNGYKGQTPSFQTQQAIFSRSESTQPLLDCEENADMLLQEGSRHSQRSARQPCFTNTAQSKDGPDPASQLEVEQQGGLEPLDFYPLEEDSGQTTPTDSQSAAAASSRLPQRGGYRPQ